MPRTPNSPPTLEHLIGARYGQACTDDVEDVSDAAATVLRVLLAHRSVRRFSARQVDDRLVSLILAAAQSASTSSNKQSWSAIAVSDRERIAYLADHAGASPFVADAPLVLAFVADWARAAEVAAWDEAPADGADYIESTLVGFVDASVAAQNAAVAAEALGLGVCFLGSLRNEPEKIAQHLNLPARTMVVLGMAVGHPDAEPSGPVKPRLAQEVVLGRERYRPVDRQALAEYDQTLLRFYESIGREPTSWSAEVVERVRDAAGLHGRHTMRESLRRRGLPSQ